MTKKTVLVLIAAISLFGSASAEVPINDFDRFINNGKSLVCGVDWSSGRWRTPVGVFLSHTDDARWIGWVHFYVYDIAPSEFTVKKEDRFKLVLAREAVVLVLQDLDISIRILNDEAETVDTASGHCRVLDQERFSVTVNDADSD